MPMALTGAVSIILGLRYGGVVRELKIAATTASLITGRGLIITYSKVLEVSNRMISPHGWHHFVFYFLLRAPNLA
jgi:hypothetical protein